MLSQLCNIIIRHVLCQNNDDVGSRSSPFNIPFVPIKPPFDIYRYGERIKVRFYRHILSWKMLGGLLRLLPVSVRVNLCRSNGSVQHRLTAVFRTDLMGSRKHRCKLRHFEVITIDLSVNGSNHVADHIGSFCLIHNFVASNISN